MRCRGAQAAVRTQRCVRFVHLQMALALLTPRLMTKKDELARISDRELRQVIGGAFGYAPMWGGTGWGFKIWENHQKMLGNL